MCTQPEHSSLSYLGKQIKRLAEHDHFPTESKYRAVPQPPAWCINPSRLSRQSLVVAGWILHQSQHQPPWSPCSLSLGINRGMTNE